MTSGAGVSLIWGMTKEGSSELKLLDSKEGGNQTESITISVEKGTDEPNHHIKDPLATNR